MTSYGVVGSRDASERCFQLQCTGYRYDSKSMADFVVDCYLDWTGRMKHTVVPQQGAEISMTGAIIGYAAEVGHLKVRVLSI
jgi:hypothetical protein